MIDKAILADIARDVLTELGLRRWRVFYADAEPETLINKQPAPDTAANLRFHLHTDDGETAHIIRLRISAEVLTDASRRDVEIRVHLLAGLRRAHFESKTQ